MIIGIGCDILAIKRIENIIDKTPSFIKHVFSSNEQIEYHKRNNNIYYLASRFAAKEAIIKALSKYDHKLNNIEILNDINGKPYVIIDKQKQNNIHISLSYEKEYVIAYAVLSSI